MSHDSGKTHVFPFDEAKAAQVMPAEAARLVGMFRLPGERTFLQTFADGPDELYWLDPWQDRSGKPRETQKYTLAKADGKGRTSGPTATGGSFTLEEVEAGQYTRQGLARVGVFWNVNVLKPEAKRRQAHEVARVAAVFVDLDGAPLPGDGFHLPPTAVVESSPGRYHAYWAVADLPLDEFSTAQKYLAGLYGGDTSVHDLPRVMRLPGYWHGKKELGFLTRILEARPDAQYSRAALLGSFPGLRDALGAAQAERERQQQEAAERRAEADRLRGELSSNTAGTRAEVQRKYGEVTLLNVCADVLGTGEGGRNKTLNWAAFRAGQMVGGGFLDESRARAELLAVGQRVGLGEHEVERTVSRGLEAGKEKPVDAAKVAQFVGVKRKTKTARLTPRKSEQASVEKAKEYKLPHFPQGTQEGTDEANALILAGNGLGERLRYSIGLGWYVYQAEAGVWRADPEMVWAAQVAGDVLREVVGQYFADAIRQRVDEDERERIGRWAKAVCSNHNVANALKAAVGKSAFLTPVEAWDARPDLLNCRNGVLDLTAGTLRPHSPDDLMTWQAGAAFDPDARHPYVDQLRDLLRADGRHDFLQRTVGSALYGEAPNETFTVLQGGGGTGKGTLTAATVGMLGDYAGTIEVNLLLSNARGESATGPKPELLMLRGKRLIVAGEPPKGARFNAGRVKGMTGNDPITARNMHSPAMVTFSPVFKLWIHTNYPIGAAHDDSGLQRRIRVVPFTAKPAKADAAFKRTLEHDPLARSALLNWALEGCRAWLASGYELGESEAVTQATGGYWKDQNPYEKFVTEVLDLDPNGEIKSDRLKALFEGWAEDNGAKLGRTVKMAELHGYLRQHGGEAVKGSNGARKWIGVRERDLPPSTPDEREQTSVGGGAGGAGGGTSPVSSTHTCGDEKTWGRAATAATAATRDDALRGQPSGWVGADL